MYIELALLVGFISGLLVGLLYPLPIIAKGVLKIDDSDPEKDIYRLEIDDLDRISKKKRIIVKVKNHADLSQK